MARRSTERALQRWRDIELDRLAYYYYIGRPIAEISRLLARPANEVFHALDVLGMLTDEDREELGHTLRTEKRERTRKKWTEQEERILEALAAQQVCLKDICYALGRTERAVYMHMEQRGIYGNIEGYPIGKDPGRWTQRDSERLREMYVTDADIPVLAEYFDRSEKAIQARLFSMGLSRTSPLPPLRGK